MFVFSEADKKETASRRPKVRFIKTHDIYYYISTDPIKTTYKSPGQVSSEEEEKVDELDTMIDEIFKDTADGIC